MEIICAPEKTDAAGRVTPAGRLIPFSIGVRLHNTAAAPAVKRTLSNPQLTENIFQIRKPLCSNDLRLNPMKQRKNKSQEMPLSGEY